MSATGGPRRRVLVVTSDPLQVKMAGPGIRAWHIAKTLGVEHDVKLRSTSGCSLSGEGFDAGATATAAEVRVLVEWADILVVHGDAVHAYPFIRDSGKILVADLYDPFHLEQLEQTRRHDRPGRDHLIARATAVIDELCLRGDFFLCASERQRAFWLGHLAALGRVNVASYDADATLQTLFGIVPFGIPEQPPVRRRRALKGNHPGIGPDDTVILWGGGIYEWFDPLTVIRSVGELAPTHPAIRLFFLGMRHPHPGVPEMPKARQARELADALGLTGSHVFFNDSWVDYADRADYLLDADIGVSCHLESVETEFSFRTRMLDYLWAGLPMVATRGDVFADLIEKHRLGATVAPGDVRGFTEALRRLIDDVQYRRECRERTAAVADQYRWPAVLQPLVAFCRSPRRAPDLVDPLTARRLARASRRVAREVEGWRRDLDVLTAHYQLGGLRRLAARVRRQITDRR